MSNHIEARPDVPHPGLPYLAQRVVEAALGMYHGSIQLPPAVLAVAARVIQDQIGIQVGCARLPWSTQVHEYVCRQGGVASATVVVHGTATSPELAAFANATFGHAQDFDDTTPLVQTHAGAVIVPVALAIGEQVGASGAQVLRAVTVGLEVMLRVAHSVSPDCLRSGHHTPPAVGPFGAAIAAGLLQGLSAEELAHALAIAGSFSGGLTEYTQTGGSVKRMHTAIPTTAGIRAAALARAGMTGPVSVFEGAKGFCRVFAQNPSPVRIVEGLGEEFLIGHMGFKAYNCCYFIHAPLEAFTDLVTGSGLTASDIDRVYVGTSAHGLVHVGSIPEPHDEVGAQFSIHFTVARSLFYDAPVIDSYGPAELADQRVREFARRIVVFEDDTATREYPDNWGGVVELITTSGERLTRRCRHPLGTPQRPMTPDQMEAKFLANTSPVLGTEVAATVLCILSDLEHVPTIAAVMRHLCPQPVGDLEAASA
ncbi:MmgE/PrpD family protein [Acidiferrimicrobium sp. IK]|uniref:MmgE/PrpD family protein n=1 Tax=Acidiferrimicrobium sp. IK TaxID=2871700 RepID=UPI0021CB2815|nr:MmgE/PrpD family protein [Acidiferrimicrobium sp. IK]MCU4186327.1 MmgE/PrpD family protein [Acidiferrimicrobium sp. IK]